MPLDFPANPVNGQAYGAYIYNAAVGAWQAKEDPATVAVTSDVAPASANNGDIWYNTTTGVSYVYYNDGNSGQWVEIVSSAVPNLNTKANLDGGNSFTGTQTFGTPIGLSSGGTNASLTGVNGGVVWSSATALGIIAAGTSGQVLKSNGAAAPSWQTLDLSYLPDAAFKKSVKAATTANITLSGTQTIDGIALVAGDRVLVKNQSTASENGIYNVASGSWTRPADANLSSEMGGAVVNVDSGGQGGQLWTTSFKTTDTLGTTAMNWYRVVDTSYTIPVSQGGTGASTFTSGAYLKGAGTSAITAQTGVPATDLTGTINQASLPAGTVLQVVNTKFTTLTTTASTSFVNFTTATFTPKRSNSLVLIQAMFSTSHGGALQVRNHNGTSIFTPPVAYHIFAGVGGPNYDVSTIRIPYYLQCTDLPGTTATRTYYFDFRVYSGTFGINEGGNGVSSITFTEIAQ